VTQLIVSNDTKCESGSPFCCHKWSEHYISNDGTKDGCSHYDDYQRDGGPCFCRGFAVRAKTSMEIIFPPRAV
jgi:hypothetical protein